MIDYESIETTERGPGVTEEEWDDEFEGCECAPRQCSVENKCSCLRGNVNNFTEDGRVDTSEVTMIVECSENCTCATMPNPCRNRLLQNGTQKMLEVFRTKQKGHGVKSLELIRKGELVCEYAGECIGEEEVKRRYEQFKGQDNYTLTLKEQFGPDSHQKTFIDPRLRGNIGRFLNHSCDPNCEVVVVRLGRSIPTAGIFAKRNIDEGEELCYDYGTSSLDGEDRRLCHCGAANCRGFLPCSATPSE